MFVEIKRPGNKPTALQLHEMDLLTLAGVLAIWGDDFQQLVEEIDDWLVPDCI